MTATPSALRPIVEVARDLDIGPERLEPYGRDKAKVHLEALDKLERFLCGECSLIQLHAHLTDHLTDGRRRIMRAEVFKLMCGE